MRTRIRSFAFIAILLAGSTQAQETASKEALLAGGKVLLSQLKGEPSSDEAVFRQVGPDRTQQLLQAVANHGLEKNATFEDWAAMHRAYDSLTSFEQFRANPIKAAAYAFLNEMYYRSDEKDFEAALACGRKALELNSKAGQPLHLSNKSIGEDLRSLGRLAEAMEHFREAERSWPDQADKSAADLGREMIQTLLALGKREEAAQHLEGMMRRSVSAPPIYQARARQAQADLLFADGKFAAGIEAVKLAVAATRATPDEALFAWDAASQLSGAIIDGLGKLAYSEALDLARLADTQLPGLPIQVVPFAQSAIRQRRRLAGDLDSVLRKDTARVEAARKNGDLSELVESLKSLATSYLFVNGMPQRAVALAEAVATQERMFPAGINAAGVVVQSSYLNALNSLGQTYLALGQGSLARRAFDTALRTYASNTAAATLDRLRGKQEEALMGKADAFALDDDPDGAGGMLRKLLTTVSKANRPYVLLDLGRLERTLNENPPAAVDAYEQAIDALRTTLDYPQELAARLTLVRYLATKAAGRLPDARQKAIQHLTASETVARGMNYADASWRLDYLHGVLAETENPQQAVASYRQAVAKLDQLRDGLSQQEQRQSFIDNESVQDLYTRLIALLTHAGLRDDAWHYLERFRAKSFLDALQGRRFASSKELPEVARLAKMETQLRDLRFELSPDQVEVLRRAGREPAAHRQQMKDLQAQFLLAREQASLSQKRGAEVLSLMPPPLAQIQKSLGAHDVLLEYGLLDGEITVFVVTAGNVDQISWKTDTAKLRRTVVRLTAMLADPQSTEWPALLDQASKILLSPLAAKIPHDTQKIQIIPAGYLNYLPFQVLSLPDGRALVDAYDLSYLPSSSALLYLGSGPQKTGELFLGALGDRAVDSMPPLPGTLVETAGIAASFPDARRVSGTAFTHDEAKAALLTADTVHFATHGLLEDEAPLFSALLTAPAPGQPSRVSLYELVGMRLRAKLVVLSACQTGLGKLRTGDEVMGLTRTFLAAGADTVVASLWKVSDESTAMLMAEFYRRLGAGLTPAEALRESSFIVRTKYRHPFYWAPFVVTGRN